MLTIFIIAALAIFLLSLDFGWSNVLTSKRNDIVFEHRNHDYGAYALRREHHLNLFYALIIGSGVVAGLISLLALKSNVRIPEVPALSMIAVDIAPDDVPQTSETEEEAAPQRRVAASAPVADTEVEVTPEPLPAAPIPVAAPVVGPTDPLAGLNPPAQGPIGSGGAGNGNANTAPPDPPIVIHDYASEMPEFPGGDKALTAYVQSLVTYDEMSIEQGLEGTVYISFVVTASGEVDHVKVIRGIPNGKRLEHQALEAVRRLPKWKPGKQNDIPVAVRKTIPVRFDIK